MPASARPAAVEFDLAQVDALLTTTRAVRRRLDLDRPVPRAVVEDCLRLAFQAPNGQNQQTWNWILIDDPATRRAIADLYRAADLVAVPSYNESFGLVALEAQACGTPVVAAAVGGLVTAVRDGVSGVLVDSHNPVDWARVLRDLLASPARRAALSLGAIDHARGFSWDRTAAGLLAAYRSAAADHHEQRLGDLTLVRPRSPLDEARALR